MCKEDITFKTPYEILFEDDYLIAVNKPAGIFVHRSSLDPSATIFMVQEIRNQIGIRVYPVHRLDRKTSGVLLMAKNKEVQSVINEMFRLKGIQKKYLAIVRGYIPEQGTIDYPLKNDSGKIQEAVTSYINLKKVEINESSGRFDTARYSLVEVRPVTGRMHQIRKHLSHIFHPIIGDRPHGCNKQNKFFLERFQLKEMMLHATQLTFMHPISEKEIIISSNFSGEFARIYTELGFNKI
ncbi:MAG: pseudouridine synthase [Saprospiraceae bacterium]